MTLRLRLLLVITLVTAIATCIVAWAGYTAAISQLDHDTDSRLTAAAGGFQEASEQGEHVDTVPAGAVDSMSRVFPTYFSPQFPAVRVQVLDTAGAVKLSPDGETMPVEPRDAALAVSRSRLVGSPRDVILARGPHRMMTAALPGGGAVQVAVPLDGVENTAKIIRDTTLFALPVTFAAAVVLAWLTATGVVRKLRRLTDVAEEVTVTGRLDVPVPASGRDEAGRLGTAFNRMLLALASSQEEQRRLVEDVGHELRTPLTSIRANLRLLSKLDMLSEADRRAVLSDLDSESRELTNLVNEIVDIASDRYATGEPAELVLGDAAREVVRRAGRRHRRDILLEADTSAAVISRAAFDRALGNLLENAVKFDTSGQPLTVRVRDGAVSVTDHGPGIRPEETEKVFARFYRSAAARALPGSGLGLAIVHDIATAAGGSVFARAEPDGGATVGFTLPPADDDSDE